MSDTVGWNEWAVDSYPMICCCIIWHTDSYIFLFLFILDASPTWGLCDSEHWSYRFSYDKLRHVYVTTDGKVTNQLVPSTIELSLKSNKSISFSHHVLLSYLRYVCRILLSRIPPSISRYARHRSTHNLGASAWWGLVRCTSIRWTSPLRKRWQKYNV